MIPLASFMSYDMSKETLELISVILSAIIIILGWLYNRRTEEIKIMRSQLSERKHKAYADIIATFYSVLKDVKSKHQTNDKLIESKMLDSKRDIFMYGSDKVFRAFNNWLMHAATPYQFDAYLEFILSIREDICGKTKLKKDDILLNLLQSKEELKEFKEMMNSQKNTKKQRLFNCQFIKSFLR